MPKEEDIKKISIDELPKYSIWVERLLHLKPFTKPTRNLAKIDAELLEYYSRFYPGRVKKLLRVFERQDYEAK